MPHVQFVFLGEPFVLFLSLLELLQQLMHLKKTQKLSKGVVHKPEAPKSSFQTQEKNVHLYNKLYVISIG
jgi:hypothetical protein